jgi:hypothetical protein
LLKESCSLCLIAIFFSEIKVPIIRRAIEDKADWFSEEI